MRLSHFSEAPGIGLFEPRPVKVPSARPAGQAWLNGPLVWAIDEAHERLYLFPRECPRILLWRTAATTASDADAWFSGSPATTLAFVENAWSERLSATTIFRYDFEPSGFEDLRDVGMWVSRVAVRPIGVEAITDLPGELRKRQVELRFVDSLLPMRGVWGASLHASGIRLRNAHGWGEPGWPHSRPL